MLFHLLRTFIIPYYFLRSGRKTKLMSLICYCQTHFLVGFNSIPLRCSLHISSNIYCKSWIQTLCNTFSIKGCWWYIWNISHLQVLAGLLNMADRADWKNCKLSKEDERQMVERFKNRFEEYDPNRWIIGALTLERECRAVFVTSTTRCNWLPPYVRVLSATPSFDLGSGGTAVQMEASL